MKKNDIKLYVTADDFGMSENVNNAIVDCFNNNTINFTSLMVNTKSLDDAINKAIENEFFSKVGFHLNLVDGEPVLKSTKESKLCTNGFFNGSILKKKYYFYIDRKTRRVIRNEADAQIKLFLSKGFAPIHFDSHHHTHIKFFLYLVIKPLLKKYKFRKVRIALNTKQNEKIGLLKSFYRFVFNRLILPYRIKGSSLIRTHKFGTIDDYFLTKEKKDFEIMVHPIIEKDELLDATSCNYNCLSKYKIIDDKFVKLSLL